MLVFEYKEMDLPELKKLYDRIKIMRYVKCVSCEEGRKKYLAWLKEQLREKGHVFHVKREGGE